MVGEAQRVRPSRSGHVYFELVEKGRGDQIVGKLDAVIWRNDHQRIQRELASADQNLADGQTVRCRVQVDFWPPGGRLQLVVREIDPVFTLGLLEKRRRETLAALEQGGLLERNRALALPDIPLRLGLITSAESAAYHDFLSTLTESGYGFHVTFVHAAMQGAAAEREVEDALALLGRLASRLDVVVLTRGGGSRTDLAAFDSRRIAEAVARAPLPVFTGLGHEIDQSIADLVSHTAFKTPTKVAEDLVSRVEDADLAVLAAGERLRRLAVERLRRAVERLERYDRLAAVAARRVDAEHRRLDALAAALGRAGRRGLDTARARRLAAHARLATAAPRAVGRARREPERLARRIAAAAAAHLREARAVLDGRARLCAELHPRRTLARGYSITRDIQDRIVRDPARIAPGDELRTEFAGGILRSRALTTESATSEDRSHEPEEKT